MVGYPLKSGFGAYLALTVTETHEKEQHAGMAQQVERRTRNA